MKVGTIVQIDNINSLIMITGIRLYKDFDYIGTLVYDNNIEYEKIISFNHNNIIQVYDEELEGLERSIIEQTKSLLLNAKLESNIEKPKIKKLVKKRNDKKIIKNFKNIFKRKFDPSATAAIKE